MGTKKISELDELTELNNDDLLAVVDSTNEATKKISVANLMKEISKKYSWNIIANYQTTNSNTTLTISNITSYNEFLIGLTPNGAPTRFLNSAVIPKELFLTNADASNGVHQVSADTRSCGTSYRGDNQLKLYTGAYSGIVVYAR